MSNVAVFGVGLLVTILVAGAMALLIWGAIIDGREDAERRVDNHVDPVVDRPAGARGAELGVVGGR